MLYKIYILEVFKGFGVRKSFYRLVLLRKIVRGDGCVLSFKVIVRF